MELEYPAPLPRHPLRPLVNDCWYCTFCTKPLPRENDWRVTLFSILAKPRPRETPNMPRARRAALQGQDPRPRRLPSLKRALVRIPCWPLCTVSTFTTATWQYWLDFNYNRCSTYLHQCQSFCGNVNQNQDLCPDFWIDPDLDICQIVPKMQRIHSLVGVPVISHSFIKSSLRLCKKC